MRHRPGQTLCPTRVPTKPASPVVAPAAARMTRVSSSRCLVRPRSTRPTVRSMPTSRTRRVLLPHAGEPPCHRAWIENDSYRANAGRYRRLAVAVLDLGHRQDVEALVEFGFRQIVADQPAVDHGLTDRLLLLQRLLGNGGGFLVADRR